MQAVGFLLDKASAGGGRIITNDGLDTNNESKPHGGLIHVRNGP
jgi:hypothetical protein